MVKTIKQLADELGVSKQTIQYHYQRLPTKDQQKDSQGKNLISPLAENIIKDRVSKPLLAKNHQNDSKEPTKTSKEDNDLIATLRREVRDLKSERDKQLATKDQQISNKDQQIDQLTKLIDQQQQLQLTTVAENRKLKERFRKLGSAKKQHLKDNDDKLTNKNEIDDSNTQIHKDKTGKRWWHFWKNN
ncbi:MAG: DUF536 domain-containing protein [Liquorilactobacillus satsumensis]|uniref:DUF536 domain-containing protein n=1 Tax=Liquorilactobacillus satsumensis TaxID=259059 RepID=UPI0039ED2841